MKTLFSFVCSVIFLCGVHLLASENFFDIKMPKKYGKKLSYKDYEELQAILQKKDVSQQIKALYEKNAQIRDLFCLEHYQDRITRGFRQILIDRSKGFYPVRKLLKFGSGGDRCLVCFASYNGLYPQYIRSIKKALSQVGFNGYFLYYIGGWPNPTGKEVQYIAVPYSFKIFAMVDAFKQGFSNVLWIDSSCLPLKNIDPLFDIIEKDGGFFEWNFMKEIIQKYNWDQLLFPSTHKILYRLNKIDVLTGRYICARFMGIKMNSPEGRSFVKEYYKMVRHNDAFLSATPEEFVIDSIVSKQKYQKWFTENFSHFFAISPGPLFDSPENIENARKEGHYFFLRLKR